MTGKTMEVPRDLAVDICSGLRITQERAVAELRELLDAPAGWLPCSPELLEAGVDCATAPRWASKEWDGHSHWHPAPAAQPQGEPVAFIQIPKNIEKYGHGDQADRLKFGKPGQFFVNGESPMFDFVLLYAEQPAPVAVVPTYKPGLYAVRHIDNWDGERDVALTFAMLDADGKWTDNESGAPLLTYQGDKILRAWPLDCSEAPDTQIIGVPRNWLEDWALELVEAAQDGGTMSNQVEHLLQLHPKQ